VKAANKVIQGLGNQAGSLAAKTGGVNRPVADLGPGAIQRPDVDAQRFGGGRSFALLTGGQMDGTNPDHARDAIAPDPDRFPSQILVINTTHLFKAENAVAFVLNEHKADFVHVSSQHDAQVVRPLARTDSQHVPHGIYFDLLGRQEQAQLLQDNRTHLALFPGYGASVA
jgi:hypothetical protein